MDFGCSDIGRMRKRGSRRSILMRTSLVIALFTICLSMIGYDCLGQAKGNDSIFVKTNGDTVKTGIPIRIRGKQIRGIQESNQKIIAQAPQKVAIASRLFEAGKWLSVQITGDTMQKKSSHPIQPITIEDEPKIVLARAQEIMDAGSPVMKDLALVDIQYLSLDQGLRSSSIYAIYSDRHGYLWIGTDEGVTRYDGSGLWHFSVEQGLLDNVVFSIHQDREGNLWFGTQGGLCKFDGVYFYQYGTGSPFHQNAFFDIAEDQDGNLWFATGEAGLLKYDGKRFYQYSTQHGLPTNFTTSLAVEGPGRVWVGTSRGLVLFDGTTLTRKSLARDDPFKEVRSLLLDDDQNLWVGCRPGISKCEDGKMLELSGVESATGNEVTTILQDSNGVIWLGTRRAGILRYDGHSFTRYTDAEGLPQNWIHTGIIDPNGELWLGTRGYGLVRFRPSSFSHLSTANGLSHSNVQSILEDKNGHTWYGTSKGLTKFDGSHFYHYGEQQGFFPPFVQDILEDSRGHLWFATHGDGAVRFDGVHFIYYTSRQGLSSNYLYSMIEDHSGRIWFATLGGGICRLDSQNFTHYTMDEGLTANEVLTIFEDKDQNIWLGTWNGGVSRFDGQYITHFTTNEGLVGNTVQTISQDATGHLWFGTRSGLSIYDDDQFLNYGSGDGLSHPRIWSIQPDGDGRIWVSTEKGLTLMVRKASSDSHQLNAHPFAFYRFGKLNGLKRWEFERNSVLLDSKNTISWGTSAGAVSLDLNQYSLPDVQPKLFLNTIKINDVFRDYRSEQALGQSNRANHMVECFDSVAPFTNLPTSLHLPYDLNHLTFRFSAIDWSSPQDLTYQFKLEGLDYDWSSPTSEGKADYRNISPGHYTLQVRAQGQAQRSSLPLNYSFSISPPWWKAWWAYLFYVLAFCALAFGIWQYEWKRRSIAAEAIKQADINNFMVNFYTNITHEFRTPLTVILGMADTLRVKLNKTGDPNLNSSVEMIERNGKKLLNLVNDMLDLAKLEEGTMKLKLVQSDIIPFIKYVSESFQSLAEDSQIKLTIYSEIEQIVMDFDPNKLAIIISNLISNAIKFTPSKGKIIVHVTKREIDDVPHAVVKVVDNGTGLSEADAAQIFDRFYQAESSHAQQISGTGIGLSITKELVGLMQGTIQVKSALEKGSTFEIRIPITNRAPKVDVLETTVSKIHRLSNGTKEQVATMSEEASDLPIALIIEDNADVSHYLRLCLEEKYQVLDAPDGETGLQLAFAKIPDVIISDIMMPGMDGFEVCSTLKQDERTNHVPIILLTAKVTRHDKLTGLRHGADAYLVKPFDKAELFTRLEQLILLRQRLVHRISSGPFSKLLERKVDDPQSKFIQKVGLIIQKEIGNHAFGSAELSRQLHLSESQVYRKLKAISGKSTALFIRSFRLQVARDQLLNGEKTISEVAYEVGFNDPSWFSRAFKEEFGYAPSAISK